jgi:hypothetical protein
MLKFRATSTRVTDGHGANCLSSSEEVVHSWAKDEMKGGHDAVVFEVKEVLVAEYKVPRCKTPACKKRLKDGAVRCPECGRPVDQAALSKT